MAPNQEHETLVENQSEAKSHKFRVAVHVLNAIRRFGDALNPTYTYGGHKEKEKTAEEEPANMNASERLKPPMRKSRSTFTSSFFPDNGRVSFNQRGHTGHLVFAPLQTDPSKAVKAN